jgi:hypothetical protein
VNIASDRNIDRPKTPKEQASKSQVNPAVSKTQSPWKNIVREDLSKKNEDPSTETKRDAKKEKEIVAKTLTVEKLKAKDPNSYEDEKKLASMKNLSPNGPGSSIKNFGKMSKIFIFSIFKDKDPDSSKVNNFFY